MKVRIRKTSNRLANRVNKLARIHNQNVQIGHFKEQGKHYSGLTYPELLALHHMGLVPKQPPKRILDLLFVVMGNLRSRKILAAKREWLRTLDARKLLETIGQIIAKEEKDLFGHVVEPFMPPDSDGTPLYELGDLEDHTAYKTSIDKQVKEV